MVVIAVLGLALASYLVYVHYSGTRPACTAGDACLKVQTSVYSKIAGVPVALIGLIGYIGIFLSLLVPDRDEVRLATLVHDRDRRRLQRLPHLPRAVHVEDDLRGVRRQRRADAAAVPRRRHPIRARRPGRARAAAARPMTPPAGPGKRPAAEKLAS